MANEISPKSDEEPTRIYYTADRNYYAQPVDNGATIIVEKEKPTWNWCLCCVIAIFLILLIIAIIILIIYFVVGFRPKSLAEEFQLVLKQRAEYKAFTAPLGHYDLLLPEDAFYTMQNERVCIFGAGSEESYNEKHLPGARHVSERNLLIKTSNRKRQLTHPLNFEKYMRSLNVTRDCHIIIYQQQNENLGFARAAWFWWVFKTYGHPKVSLIDGGVPSWPHGTTVDVPSPATGDFKASWNPDTFILYEDVVHLVQEALTFGGTTDFQIIDTRSRELFNGSAQWVSKKPGHIRFAINMPSTELYSEGKLIDIPRASKVLRNHNVEPDTRTIIYSETVLEAAMTYFVMSQIPDFGPLQIYDGGWEEYSEKTTDPDLIAPNGLLK